MTSSMDVWFGGNKELIWDKFCGHLHYSLPAFMHIQESLLMEQIKLLQGCELGRKLLGNQRINSVEDFRQKVPLTTYEDYEPYLSKKREDVLPTKPRTWVITTGPGGQQKWVPISEKAWDVYADSYLGLFIMSTAYGEAQFTLKPGDVMFDISPPRPYYAATSRDLCPLMGLKLIPPDTEEYDRLEFTERAARGFEMALTTGIDLTIAIGSMIVTAGKSFKKSNIPLSCYFNPKLSTKLIKRWLRNRRNEDTVPANLWKLKSVLATGADLPAFAGPIGYYWGQEPFEFYINTEYTCYLGSLAWNRKFLTFAPFAGFLEFLPDEEILKAYKNPGYHPNTKLLNEVKEGELYELVFTNLNGGIFTRYRSKDIIKIVANGDPEIGVKLPQFMVKGRSDKIIDIGNLALIDEKTIWQAIERGGIKYNSWMARKEFDGNQPIISLYLDCQDKKDDVRALSDILHKNLGEIDSSYKKLELLSGVKPLRLRLLPSGTLSKWEKDMLKEGRNFAWIKEQHMQASDEVAEGILKLAKEMEPREF